MKIFTRNFKFMGIMLILIILNSIQIFGYKVNETSPIHKYITDESTKIWSLIYGEIKDHAITPINQNLDGFDFQNGEDIITGSGEEDKDMGANLC